MIEAISEESNSKRRPQFGHLKKHALRIDMTPMVDLGFLLITFFVFTSTLNEPTSMALIMPKEGGPEMPTKESGALTILPAGNGKVYYYEGIFKPQNLRSTTFRGIRDVIINKKHNTPAENLFVIIKPSKFSSYKYVVDILDEMVISEIKRYALVKITDQEELQVK